MMIEESANRLYPVKPVIVSLVRTSGNWPPSVKSRYTCKFHRFFTPTLPANLYICRVCLYQPEEIQT